MGGIVIDIWEKSNFFGSIGSQKCSKNAIFPQGGLLKLPPASCRVNITTPQLNKTTPQNNANQKIAN